MECPTENILMDVKNVLEQEEVNQVRGVLENIAAALTLHRTGFRHTKVLQKNKTRKVKAQN